MSLFSGGNPVSPKIIAAIAGAGFGTALGNVLVWVLGAAVWHGGWGADQVRAAMDAVPAPLTAVVVVLVAAICAAIPGYQVNDPLRQTLTRDPKTGRFTS